MKQPMSKLPHHGLWLVLSTLLFSNRCAARELSLYRVDGNEGNVRLHRTGHSPATGKQPAPIDDSPKESYVKAAVVHPTEKDALYRSEEAKLQHERRLMFFRNLQLGSMSLSFSLPVPEDTYQIEASWDILNSALDQQGNPSRFGKPEVSDLDLLEELVDEANAYAGYETEEQQQYENPQLRGGASNTLKKVKGDPKKIKGEKSTKTKTPKSKAPKSIKGEKVKETKTKTKTPKSKTPKSIKAPKQIKGEKIKEAKTPKTKAPKGKKDSKAHDTKVAKGKKEGEKKTSDKKVKHVKAPKGTRR